jgi:hypothetical protein
VETTGDGVWLQAKVEEFTPIIDLSGPVAKGDAVGI